jgi:hypothetical protein
MIEERALVDRNKGHSPVQPPMFIAKGSANGLLPLLRIRNPLAIYIVRMDQIVAAFPKPGDPVQKGLCDFPVQGLQDA